MFGSETDWRHRTGRPRPERALKSGNGIPKVGRNTEITGRILTGETTDSTSAIELLKEPSKMHWTLKNTPTVKSILQEQTPST